MKKFLVIIALCLPVLLVAQEWTRFSQLPNGDKPKKIITNSEYIFCFVENGLYLSDMKSGNWTLMNNNVPAPNAIEYFDTTLYIGLDNGLYISKNNGNTFEKLTNGLPSFKVWDIFCTKTEVYVSFGGYIYKTNDNGITWNKITEFKNGRAYAIVVSNDVMIAGFDGNKVLFSYDNGTTWEEPIAKIPGAGPAVENITITDSVIHVSHLGDFIWYTTDFGRNWYKISSSFNIFLKQGKEYIIWQNISNHNLCTFPFHHDYQYYTSISHESKLKFIDFCDNIDFIFGITSDSIFYTSKCIFESPKYGQLIDSSYCVNDTIKVFNNIECSQYLRFSFNDSKLSKWDLDSVEYIAGEIGLNKITERIKKYHIKYEDSISYYFYVIDNPEKPTISKSNDTLFSSAEKGNQWYLEDTLIVGAVGKSHFPLYVGNYSVKVTEGKCESEVSDKYYVDAVNVEDNTNTTTITPNPARDYIEISGVVGEVKVFDVLGIEHPATAWHPSEEGNVRIDVSSLSPGVYFVSVGGRMCKFIKM